MDRRQAGGNCDRIDPTGLPLFRGRGARGFDALAARTVLSLRARHPEIKLILVLPCQDQARGWNARDTAEYERMKACANKVVYTQEEYSAGCMHRRNRHLVDNSSICVCYLNKDGGGTDYTVGYARLKGLEVINLADGSPTALAVTRENTL